MSTARSQSDVNDINIYIFMTSTLCIYNQSVCFNHLCDRALGLQSLFQLSTLAFDCLISMTAERITWFCRSMASCLSFCICNKITYQMLGEDNAKRAVFRITLSSNCIRLYLGFLDRQLQMLIFLWWC